MNHKAIERKSLIISAIVNVIMAGAGIWVFAATNIHALFLDGVFSLIGAASAAAAVIISRASKKKTKAYPKGIYFIEPLYAIFKSFMTLGLMAVSVAATAGTAFEYFYHGIGAPMHIDPVLPYSAAMVFLCFGLSYYNNRQNQKINNISTILSAESKSNFVDGILSLGVGIVIVPLYFIDRNGSLGFLHFTGDFFVTAILCLISIKTPITVMINAFQEISGGVTCDTVIKSNIRKTVAAYFGNADSGMNFHVFKVGMHIEIRFFLPAEIKQDMARDLFRIKRLMTDELHKTYDSIELIFCI